MIDGSRKPDILIVNDTVTNLQLLAGMLRGRGYRARPAPNGRLALQAAEKEPPDLILLDVNMPEMNGYEVCRQLKTDPILRDIPVIFLSALSETFDKVLAFQSGGVDYITKPFQLEEIEARIETHLKLSSMRRELAERNQQLQESYDRLRAVEELRDGLTAMIVHDLRSPLAGVIAYLELLELKCQQGSPELMNFVTSAQHSSDVMMRMISDLLDVARLEAQQMPIDVQECDLRTVLSDAVASLGLAGRGRTVEVLGVDAETLIYCDESLTRRVVANLVGNAIKFAEGAIQVTVTREADAAARVEVADLGPGIATDLQDRIFEKFGQVAAREARRPHSTGLGLAFCKLAVEAQGGAIGVRSAPGAGSTFWFVLPNRAAG